MLLDHNSQTPHDPYKTIHTWGLRSIGGLVQDIYGLTIVFNLEKFFYIFKFITSIQYIMVCL